MNSNAQCTQSVMWTPYDAACVDSMDVEGLAVDLYSAVSMGGERHLNTVITNQALLLRKDPHFMIYVTMRAEWMC